MPEKKFEKQSTVKELGQRKKIIIGKVSKRNQIKSFYHNVGGKIGHRTRELMEEEQNEGRKV